MSDNPLSIYPRLRADLEAAGLTELRASVRAHYERLVALQQKDELVAVDLAQLLAERLDALLASAAGLTPEQRADVVGAARYFVSTEDALPDAQSCIGLDDDVAVFNHVVRALGRADLVITD